MVKLARFPVLAGLVTGLVAGLVTGLAAVSTAPAQASGARAFNPLTLDGHVVKWGAPELGTPAHVTYAFAVGPVANINARNCRAMDALDGLAAAAGVGLARLRGEARAAFRLWEAASGITFEEVTSVGEADIVIGSQSAPRGFAFTNVRHAGEVLRPALIVSGGARGLGKPGSGAREAQDAVAAPRVSRITEAAVCLNPAHMWKVGFDGDLGTYDLRYTFAHEIGHAIGLDHHIQDPSIMHFKYSEKFQGLQPGDVAGVKWLYGSRK
ncbi:matrixin family metalloprotease [Stappia sp.]|uniref:matrixin family metalloprotease n=1 Tax=Stappia sp. TaxID=1870903 RepID=UPI003D13165B